jgi:phosphoheptose isomerase
MSIEVDMRAFDLSRIKTYPLAQRRNLVHYDSLVHPGTPPPEFFSPDLEEVAERVIAARRASKPVIWMMGAHVIKCGLSPLVVNLMEHNIITHIAGNGAVSIHDFELCLIGETSEDVPYGIEDGSFGMAEETSVYMHRALRLGVRDGLGYGASIGKYITENLELFPYREIGILYNAYRLGIPATIHVTIGADIIHQHPQADFAVLGAASGRDFHLFTVSICELEGGVYLNFGSAVTGAEVFLKALTIARNLGYPASKITTANFDLHSLTNYRSPIKDTEPDYYYRPRKNIINRPTAKGGKGFHITGDHRDTISNLHQRLESAFDQVCAPARKNNEEITDNILRELSSRQPILTSVVKDLQRAYTEITRCIKTGGTIFLAGNGGSMGDALHISAELLKSYQRGRPLPQSLIEKLKSQPEGGLLVRNLQTGMRAVVIGANLSLSSAVANDMPDRDVNLAQELFALCKPGDVFLGISTSGNAQNIALAAQTARALGVTVIGLTGQHGGKLSHLADVVIRIPSQETARIQELQIQCYHALCEMLERDLVASLEA